MKRTIKWQFIFSFISISFIIIGAFSIMTITLMDNHFAKYVAARQDSELAVYTNDLETIYKKNKGWPNTTGFEQIGFESLHNSIILNVYDNENKLLWKPSTSDEIKNKQKIQDTIPRMNNMMGEMNHDFVNKTFPLFSKEEKIGEVLFSYVGPTTYSEHDAFFIADMKKNLIIVAAVALVLSIFFAGLFAKQISGPIVKVKNFTKGISKGDYTSVSPEKTEIKEIDDLILSVNDLSTQLENQQDIRNQLSSDIAHEIRTPLTTLKGNLEAMIDGIWEVTDDRLQVCYDEVNRITRLIGSIDTINEIESHQDVLHKTSFDLYVLSKNISTNFEALFAKKSIHYILDGNPLFLTADKDKMSQLITNLLSNAIKFTQNDGRITLKIRNEKNQVILTVTDTGEGIHPQEVGRIFERFYMSDPSRQTNLSGQGIGLSIVKSIVNAHKGSITAQSKYGEGSVFTIVLPVKK
ncbi:Signal transduction histidine kinase [Carnobacterium iners]|uniref:histidine kinase n=1 Tax=Carnobacterium iners TaxID=1073423 RepID=A0A1X7MVJ9_9LACT|nr:HAMP domain-containing sensor histidine kinase [Carnobacterium iners]SEK56812.1 Signal transduction histidine kinase [Carnobacterium iners]SMH28147.1 Signal transduction histidine kinase [Carnobacterium iners]